MYARTATMTEIPAPDLAALTDEALFQRLQTKHDASLFEILVQRHGAFAYRIAVAKCGKRELAEEVVQEVFLRMAGGHFSFKDQGDGSFRAWFYQFVVNHARDLGRSERRRSMRTQSAGYRDRTRAKAESNVAQKHEDAEAVRAALCELSEELRLPLILHFVQDLPQDEVGLLLKTSQSQVSRRIAQGLELLRNRLSAHGAAFSIVALPGLLRMEGLLNVPPDLLHSIYAMSSGSLTQDVGQEASRRMAPMVSQTQRLWALGLICCATVAVIAGWWFTRDGTSKAAPVVLESEKKPAVPQPAETEVSRPLAVWDFSKGADPELRILQSTWTWNAKHLGGSMFAPKGSNVFFQLPIALPRQPIRIRLEAGVVDAGFASIDPFWSRNETLLWPAKRWLQVRSITGHVTQFPKDEIYLFGSYLINVIDGVVTSVRVHSADLPGDHLCMLVDNMAIKRIEMYAIKSSEIPAELREPEKLVANMKQVTIDESKTTMSFDEFKRAPAGP